MILRSFVYRDDNQISEFLEQIQQGAVAETTVKHEGQSSKGGRVNAGPVGGANIDSTKTTSESFTLASTPVSRASQLEDLLGESVAPLTAMDAAAFAQVERGEFVRFDGTLLVPEVIRMAYVGAALGQLASVAEAFGETLVGADEIISQIDAVQALIRLDGFPIIAQERAGGPGLMFIARPDLIVGEPVSLHEGEFTVFGRVKRTIPDGASLSQSEVLPSLTAKLPTQNRQQRRASGTKQAEVKLAGPAVVVEPLSIYS